MKQYSAIIAQWLLCIVVYSLLGKFLPKVAKARIFHRTSFNINIF